MYDFLDIKCKPIPLVRHMKWVLKLESTIARRTQIGFLPYTDANVVMDPYSEDLWSASKRGAAHSFRFHSFLRILLPDF